MNCSILSRHQLMPISGLLLVVSVFLGLNASQASAQRRDSEPIRIEKYTGEPILLDQGEAPPPPTIVARRESKTQNYDDGTIRIEREVARYSDDSFVSNGAYREYYANGKLFVEGTFNLGIRNGGWTFYHENGEVAKTVSFTEGQPDGAVEVFRADGTLQAKREYRAGKRHGGWFTYDETGEKVLNESHYAEGTPDGVWKAWYASGQQLRETPFKDGKRHGKASEWNEDGSPRAEVEFSEGQRDGLSVQWSATGERFERRYKAGKPVATDE